MPKLFHNDDDSELKEKLNVNTDYAKNYDDWRKKEELNKLKARYGDNVELLQNSEDDSSDSSEDDEGNEISEEFEKTFFKTLACLKNKDPRIYNKNIKFFNETETVASENEPKKKEKKEKSVFLRDYERQIIVEKGGKLSDDEDENLEKRKPNNRTYVQEQKDIKESFIKALNDEDEDEGDLFLKPKSKTTEESKKEEEDYLEWLKGQKEDIDDKEKNDLKPLRDYWNNPKLDKNEKFLRDYVLNKKFLDNYNDDDDNDDGYDFKAHDSDENLSEDEENINKQEEFEHKYNFRFEEPDQEFIKRYPRTLENSLRKKDTRRVQKRAEVKARKEQEKVKKKEELKELKALKRKEIEERLEKLREVTGNDDIKLDMMDLEGDFDPDTYDKKMNELFNDDYYAGEEGDQKPEFPEVDEELGVESNWDNYDPENEEIVQEYEPYHEGPHCEDPDFNMDADHDGEQNLHNEMVEGSKRKKKRRRSKFAEMISTEKPKFDPSKHPSYQKYYDQYYALDYEDMIGDLPCRFKYRQVVPNDYGLTIEEILMADDKELNKWCSLKKALQHKTEHAELNDVKMFKQKAANEALKRKILTSLYRSNEGNDENPPAETPETCNQQDSKKKRKRKRKSNVNNKGTINQVENEDTHQTVKKFTHDDNDSNKFIKEDFKKESDKQVVEIQETQYNVTETEVKSKIEDQVSKKKKRKANNKVNSSEETIISKKKKDKSDIVQENPDQIDTTTKSLKSSSENKKSSKLAQNPDKKKSKKDESKVPSKKELRKEKYKKIQKKKEKKEELLEKDQISSMSAERLKAYGLNPKKFKNKLKYMKKK